MPNAIAQSGAAIAVGTVRRLAEAVERRGAEVLLETRAEKILLQERTVAGVVAGGLNSEGSIGSFSRREPANSSE